MSTILGRASDFELTGNETAFAMDLDLDDNEELVLIRADSAMILDPRWIGGETRFDCVRRNQRQIGGPDMHWSLGMFDAHLPWRINAKSRRIDQAIAHRSDNYLGVTTIQNHQFTLNEINRDAVDGLPGFWNLGRLFPVFLDMR